MEIDRHKLPEDPAALRQMVAGLLEELDSRERRLQQLQHMVEKLRVPMQVLRPTKSWSSA